MQRLNGAYAISHIIIAFSTFQAFNLLTSVRNRRPKSKNAHLEDAPPLNQPFDYTAVPSKFYFDLESIGNLEPDAVVVQGIKVLQQKLAKVIQELTGSDDGRNGAADGDGFGMGGRSPDAMAMQDGYGDQGYTTPYLNGGAQSAWGGAATPYGQTPGYGQDRWGQ